MRTYVVRIADKDRQHRAPVALIPASTSEVALQLAKKIEPDRELFVEETGHLEWETVAEILVEVCRYANAR